VTSTNQGGDSATITVDKEGRLRIRYRLTKEHSGAEGDLAKIRRRYGEKDNKGVGGDSGLLPLNI